MMKKLLRALAFVLLLSLASVALAETAGENTVFTQEMIDRSLVSIGNTERLHRAIEKAQRGEQVTIAYLGGSITEGAGAQPQRTKCYAYASAKLFAKRFMPDEKQLLYVNAGISGTPSLLGITRLQQDVLSKHPDIVFVEFAVNDGTDAQSREVYESLVRKLLNSETQPAVILIFTLLDSGYSAQSHMQQIGSHYDLGMISVRDAIQPQINLGKMTWKDYSNDYAHPNTKGHAFIADLIDHYMAQAAQTEPTPWQMPETARYGKGWEALTNIVDGDDAILSVGSFPYGVANCYSYRKGWVHRAAKGGTDPLVLQVEGSRMTIAFKQENNRNCATAEIWVDGKLAKKLPGYASNAWGNVVTEVVFLGESGPHTVELRINEEDAKKNFTLLGIGLVP